MDYGLKLKSWEFKRGINQPKKNSKDTTQKYLNWEVVKIHATTYDGKIVLRVAEPK